ncbi:MAG: hypothetical protein QME52_06915 [Bacteroidota bacterium]|nr:hypothetical protein [Bacteroidota bacterium]
MITVKKKQYLTDQSGKRTGVILDMRTFEKIEEELDELACIHAYDKAKPDVDAAIQRGDYMTLDEYLAERSAKHKGKRNKRRK